LATATANYAQAQQVLEVVTPLGKDVLLLEGFSGHEGLSQLFRFQLDLIAENGKVKDVAFDKLLGQPVTVCLGRSGGKQRFFNGICSRFSQGESGIEFTSYRMEVVPRFWLLTRRAQSRIFQHKTVPDILKEVLQGLEVTFELKAPYQPRDFCVQYRETDFNFACRLMEEEGIYYFFKHTEKGHSMVVADTPQSHPDLPGGSTVTYRNLTQAAVEQEDIIYDWSKAQEVTSGKYTLWDHCFELPHKHLEAEKQIGDSLQVGKASHKLKVADNSKLEIYDWPGEYAQRFDGIDKGGGERPAELQKIFDDNKRTVNIRMQQEAATAVSVQGASNCRQLVPGYKFTLAPEPKDPLLKLLNADGAYVLTGVSHSARGGDYRSDGAGFQYHNTFTCIPAALPFRPQRTTPKPVVPGSQTAVVVGPAGEEIFTDKYGRVKVQFHWDRQGKHDAGSACWVRVATPWAGKQWGMIHIPRIGQEVLVDFLEGDPDQPIIVGSVYNAEQMPPYGLPGNRTQSGIKSRSSLGGSQENFNEICLEDKKGSELIYIRAEKDHTVAVENDETKWVGHDRWEEVDNDRSLIVGHDKFEHVKNNKSIQIDANHTETINKGMSITVMQTLTETVALNYAETVGGAMELTVGAVLAITVGAALTETVGLSKTESIGGSKSETIGSNMSVVVGKSITETVKENHKVEIGKDVTEKVGGQQKVEIAKELIVNAKRMQFVAADEFNIKTGSAEIIMKKNGDITIKGNKINIKGSGDVIIKGSKIAEN
jgi:type VI secretion system secreted protein VgrG